jgi:predicted TIM-barrel fold metal-dependent hydrolase
LLRIDAHTHAYPQIIPFASLTPHSPTAEEDLAEALALGLQGIKIHSLLQRIDLVDSQTLGWLGMIQEAGLPVLLDSIRRNPGTGSCALNFPAVIG